MTNTNDYISMYQHKNVVELDALIKRFEKEYILQRKKLSQFKHAVDSQVAIDLRNQIRNNIKLRKTLELLIVQKNRNEES